MIHSIKYGTAGFRPMLHEGGTALVRRQKRLLPLFDHALLAETYSPASLDALLASNSNVFILQFAQGFSKQEESEDRELFKSAAAHLQKEGAIVLAGISAGHADASGRPRDLFAKRRNGRRIPSWIPGFNMACWSNHAWLAEITECVTSAMAAGADGVCFDTLIFGAAPLLMHGMEATGPAGCSCALCRESFNKFLAGKSEPAQNVFPPPPASGGFASFAEWRSNSVASAVSAWCGSAKAADPEAITAASLLLPCQLDSEAIFGASPDKIIDAVDVVISETNNAVAFDKNGLIYDSPSLETLAAHSAGKCIAAVARPAGPHIDALPPEPPALSQFREAAACGSAPVLRSTEYFNAEDFSPVTLCGADAEPLRSATSVFWNWIDRNPSGFEDVSRHASTGVLHSFNAGAPGSIDRRYSIEYFFKLTQTLLELHVPFKVVTPAEDVELKLLIVPPSQCKHGIVSALRHSSKGTKLLFLGTAPDWSPADNRETIPDAVFETEQNIPAPTGIKLTLMDKFHNGTPAVYLQHKYPARGAASAFLRTPGIFRIPKQWKRILDAVKSLAPASETGVEVEAPPYIHVREWRGPAGRFFIANNLMPGFPGPAHFVLRFQTTVSAKITTPDKNKISYVQDRSISAETATFAIVEIR